MNSSTHLTEHCDAPGCISGFTSSGLPCAECQGTTRRRRHTHDPRSAIDFEPTNDYAAYLVFTAKRKRREARIADLVRLLRGPENSSPLAELLDLLDGAAR